MVGELNKADLAKFMITHAQVSPPHIGSIEFCPVIPKTIWRNGRRIRNGQKARAVQEIYCYQAKFVASELSPEQHLSIAFLCRKEGLTGLGAASRPPSSRFALDSESINEGANNRTSMSLH